MGDLVISTRGLTCYYGKKCAVNQVDLAVPRGSVYAFLGRNGSGKTTTIKALMGLLDPARGEARVLGCDSRALTPGIRARIGYMAEGNTLLGWMRIRQIERYQASFHPRWKREVFSGVIEHFNLDPNQKVRGLSRGQRGGLALALALAQDPELLILDDPVLGLDPVVRRSLLEAMIYFTEQGERTILFSSHLLEEVERVADHVAVLESGVLRVQAPVETFRQKIRRIRLEFEGEPPALPEIPGLIHAERAGSAYSLTLAHCDGRTEGILRGLGPRLMETQPLSLADGILHYLSGRKERGSLLARIGGGR